ncbi:hypothetical protein F4553_007590 [Allocatelliglobosispora scoriae]|uniref:Uncharacterized protein n=1 Tax=Allocatelliglobosispora scoriae TaxID=643052 RepID=A0A841C2N1_9ACTN|nr:hypothetical protein [Allocatelliglobosispora scoriae]MBB5874156.1 hypothetical protein [Allocatelliglobosispora scoriae]
MSMNVLFDVVSARVQAALGGDAHVVLDEQALADAAPHRRHRRTRA